MKILEFAFIAYPVTDLDRAREFYEGTLGLKRTASPNDAEKFWFEYEIGPHTLGIGKSPNWKPSSDGPTLALEVDDFDLAIAELKNKGARFHMEPMQAPVCRMAVIFDPDGNKITIHKRNAPKTS
jgi:predicted enzyme related to lactoylglutathione lyase